MTNTPSMTHLTGAATVPPVIEAPEIERAIIGAVLGFCGDPRVIDGYLVAGVRAEHFWNRDYACIWRHATTLRARGIAADPQLLHHDLGAALDGGPALLYAVVDGVPKPALANIREHARLLREVWVAGRPPIWPRSSRLLCARMRRRSATASPRRSPRNCRRFAPR